jgi:DNA modification methylase
MKFPKAKILHGDAVEMMRELPDESVDCCVTSPPYWRLRDYDVDGQIGQEENLFEYLDKLILVFQEVRRVLKPAGTLWLNMGDGYISNAWGGGGGNGDAIGPKVKAARINARKRPNKCGRLKPKDLIGMPWRLALAMQDDGWYLRQDIIWSKTTTMPESVKDRCTKSHEYIFLLSKSRRYYFDADAIKEKASPDSHHRGSGVNAKIRKYERDISRVFNRRRRTAPQPRQNTSFSASVKDLVEYRNAWSVWRIPTQPRSENHWAAFPDELARRCIVAGCPPCGVVLDPFVGRGTTAIVALRCGRSAIGIELNPSSHQLAVENILHDAPLFNNVDTKRF